ncbi:hypothetical protein J8273_1462 [Carpediemonas membranifera]|uniref:Uncharacterized protein n=1 Tax=Carpediemonas membranifera TaxID=201153 RepID=A0A8J6AWC2_9EUKA|nr:hypothetical protein J8273_1462 [Carpediemonas membranifera]|eukprot:KAG9396481.1 hypothetical protein J8273_1462 [Carpediemonas membranifera]
MALVRAPSIDEMDRLASIEEIPLSSDVWTAMFTKAAEFGAYNLVHEAQSLQGEDSLASLRQSRNLTRLFMLADQKMEVSMTTSSIERSGCFHLLAAMLLLLETKHHAPANFYMGDTGVFTDFRNTTSGASLFSFDSFLDHLATAVLADTATRTDPLVLYAAMLRSPLFRDAMSSRISSNQLSIITSELVTGLAAHQSPHWLTHAVQWLKEYWSAFIIRSRPSLDVPATALGEDAPHSLSTLYTLMTFIVSGLTDSDATVSHSAQLAVLVADRLSSAKRIDTEALISLTILNLLIRHSDSLTKLNDTEICHLITALTRVLAVTQSTLTLELAGSFRYLTILTVLSLCTETKAINAMQQAKVRVPMLTGHAIAVDVIEWALFVAQDEVTALASTVNLANLVAIIYNLVGSGVSIPASTAKRMLSFIVRIVHVLKSDSRPDGVICDGMSRDMIVVLDALASSVSETNREAICVEIRVQAKDFRDIETIFNPAPDSYKYLMQLSHDIHPLSLPPQELFTVGAVSDESDFYSDLSVEMLWQMKPR